MRRNVYGFGTCCWYGIGILVLWCAIFAVDSGALDARANEPASTPMEFALKVSAEALDTLNGPELSRQDRRQAMRRLADKYLDVPRMALWVLGRSGKRASEAQRQDFVRLFQAILIETYVGYFVRYEAGEIRFIDAIKKNKKETIVKSLLITADGVRSISLDWRVWYVNDEYRVIDLSIKGVSMVVTWRNEFGAALRSNDNDMDKFIGYLESHLTKITK